jgi:diphthamide biosynthesis enzyme Dph1/Dph2-like protein
MFKEAKSIGLLVSWKKGQMFGNPFRLKNNLEKQGKKVYILAMDEISSEKIEGLKLDFLVNFACPRIEYPEFTELKTPMLNWYQVENKI